MRILAWMVRLALFVLFFLLALKNTHEVVLRFFFETELRSPMIVFMLLFFLGGMVCGLLAFVPSLFRAKRALKKSQKQLSQLGQTTLPPSP